jgi:hypothetical protein
MGDFYDELKIGIDELQQLIARYKMDKEIEIELRIGQIQFDGFKPGMGAKSFYEKVKNILTASNCWEKVTEDKYTEWHQDGIRKTTVHNGKKIKPICIKKEKLQNINLKYNNAPYDIRISVAKEVAVSTKITKTAKTVIRNKIRHSYYYRDYRIDLTEVEQICNNVTENKYELELEFLNLDSKVSDLYRAHSGFLLFRDIINMCETLTNTQLEKV